MSEWARVRWTEARQVADQFAWAAEFDGGAAIAPKAYFDKLRAAGRLNEAVQFLGQALPRHEVVAWSARAVQAIGEGAPRSEAADRALRSALMWAQDPSEHRRRAAYAAAMDLDETGPERLAALAAFFSGGSLAPESLPVVPPPKEVSGKMASSAVILAAVRSADRIAALQAALTEGDRIASEGAGRRA